MGSDSMMRQEVYQQLIHAKNKTFASLQDVLEKDLKFVCDSKGRRIAVPSISGQLVRQILRLPCKEDANDPEDFEQEFFVGPEIFAHLETFCCLTQSLGIVMLGIVNNDPEKIERDIALFSPELKLIQQVREDD